MRDAQRDGALIGSPITRTVGQPLRRSDDLRFSGDTTRTSEILQSNDVTPATEVTSDLSVRIAHVDTAAGCRRDVDRRIVCVLRNHISRQR